MAVLGKAEITISDILDGKDGAAGKGIKSIAEKYAVSSSNSTAPTTWYDSVQTMTSTNKYLWNYEIVTYTDNTTSTTAKRVIGVYGDKGQTGNNGATGPTGKGIKTITNYYLVTSASSGVTTSTSGWTTTPGITTTTNKYLWNYEKVTYTDNSTTSTTPHIIGTHGATGAAGKGIKSVTNYYLASASGSGVTASTSGWTTTIQSITATNKYLWNYEKITYTDNSTATTSPCIIGVYGDKGNTGATGPTGNGIKSITEYYQISTSNTTAPTSWVTTVPTLTATNKYLWNYEKITYTNGTSVDTAKRVIGVYGDKGNTGATGPAGKGIKSTAITYQASTSGTTAPTGAWNTSVPSVPQGQYLWSRTVITYTDNSTSTTYSVAYIPKNGQNGATGSTGPTGPTGTGIANITQQYYLSTSKTSQTGGSWVTSMPIWSSGKYLWTRYLITYKNPTSTSYTSPVCDSSWEAVNDIQVGGRNLLFETSGSTMSDYHNEWIDHGATPTSDSYHGCCIYRCNKEWSGIEFIFNKIVERSAIKVGDVLTYSIKCKTDDPTHLNGVILVANYTDNNGNSGMGSSRLGAPYTDWITLSRTFTYTQSVADQIKAGRRIRMGYEIAMDPTAADKYYYFACPKLEFGNKATDWTPAPEDVDTEIEKVTTKYTQLNNKFKWVVESGTSATDFTLTDRTATLIAQTISLNGNVKVNGTMLVDKSITTPKLATDAIKSTNYAYSSGNFSTAGTFLDLSSGIFRSKNFAVDSSGNAYFKGNIQANAGYIGGADGWSISTNRITGNANSKIVSGILESSNFVDGSAGVQINLNSGIIKGNIEATSLAAKEVIQIYTGSTRRNIIKGHLSNGFFYTMIGCDLKIGSTNLVTPYIALNKSTTSGTANDLIQISSKSVDIYGATTINDGLYTSTITSSGEIKTSTNMICNDVLTRTGWAADRLSNGQTAYIGLFNGRMRFEWTGSSINVYVDNTLVRNNW